MTIEKANEYMKQYSTDYNIERDNRGSFAVAYINEGNKYYKISIGVNSFSKANLKRIIDIFESKKLNK